MNQNIILFSIFIVFTIIFYLNCKKENFAESVGKNSTPPFIQVSDVTDNEWGCRDNDLTLQTLKWYQNQPYTFIEQDNPFAKNLINNDSLIGYHSHLVESAPIKNSNTKLKSIQRPISSIPYASW